MASTLFTADSHLGHGNVIKYANRPYSSVAAMERDIIRRANARAKKGDILIHLGDFCNFGNEKGVAGAKLHPREYEKRYDANIVHILGNHDVQNKVKQGFTSARMRFGGLLFLLQHKPPSGVDPLALECDCVLCGHVHQHWRTKWYGNVLCINVGVDVNNFNPLDKGDVVGIFEREQRKAKEVEV
jgi:calcineurin-like phosphoesterase family protein